MLRDMAVAYGVALERPYLYEESHATEKVLRGPMLSRYPLIVFGTHGFASNQLSESSLVAKPALLLTLPRDHADTPGR